MIKEIFDTTEFWCRCPFCSDELSKPNGFSEPDVYFCRRCKKTFKIMEQFFKEDAWKEVKK